MLYMLNWSLLLVTIEGIVSEMLADFLLVSLVNVMLNIEVKLLVPELIITRLLNRCILPLVYLEVVPNFEVLKRILPCRISIDLALAV